VTTPHGSLPTEGATATLVRATRPHWRETLADALPGLAAGIALFFWLPEPNLLGRALQAAVGGVAIHGVGMLAYMTALHVIHSVARRGHTPLPEFTGHRLTAASLLVVAMLVLGQHWKSLQLDEVTACLRRPESLAELRSGADPARLVHACAGERHYSATTVDDE
jgi:hypothetical protein